MIVPSVAAQSSGYIILVVDDQEEILVLTKLLLEREGHRVLTAASGEEALALFCPGQIHLVIIDYFMPGMSGEEVVREIRRQDEDVQILLQTGYAKKKPPREILQALAIQGYHDKADGPERLLLWVDVALKACTQLKKVRETEQLKAQLLSNISHELRTPLHIILGYSDILLKEESAPLPEYIRTPIEIIQRSVRMLGELVNNFLNFAKLQAGTTQLSLGSVQLADFRPELEEMVGFLLRDKPVSFLWQVDPQLPPVSADPSKLLLILRNLLSNAAKFTKQGEICVQANQAGPGEVRVAVKDTGVGIAPEHHEVIFEVFRQVDGSLTRGFDGVGIGLALARSLARMMGGEITVDSKLGAGATFTLTLKVAPDWSLSLQTTTLHTSQMGVSAALAP